MRELLPQQPEHEQDHVFSGAILARRPVLCYCRVHANAASTGVRAPRPVTATAVRESSMKSVLRSLMFLFLYLALVLTIMPNLLNAAEITLTYANFPPASTFPCVQMERWKEEVEKRTQGKVAVQTFPGGTLLGAKNMYDGVMQGQSDIGNLCMSYQPGVFPLTTVLELPVSFTSSVVPSLVLWDLYEKYQPDAFKDVKVLAMFTTAPSNVMSKVPVRSLADLKGLELRASGGASTVLDLLGAVPVSMPMSETPEALQKGLVKGLLSSLEVLMDFNFAESCRFQTMTNFQVYPFAVIMNKDKWEQLPDDVKKVFDDLAREQAEWTGKYMDEHVQRSLEWSREKYGIEVIELPQAELDQAAQMLAPMIDAWKEAAAQAGLPAEEVYADMLALKAKYEEEYGK
jgi:TRAP-type transport system periplasmic protein